MEHILCGITVNIPVAPSLVLEPTEEEVCFSTGHLLFFFSSSLSLQTMLWLPVLGTVYVMSEQLFPCVLSHW